MDPDLFYPEGDKDFVESVEGLAKRVCDRCPVELECRDYGLEHNEPFGIWGGLNRQERQAVLKLR